MGAAAALRQVSRGVADAPAGVGGSDVSRYGDVYSGAVDLPHGEGEGKIIYAVVCAVLHQIIVSVAYRIIAVVFDIHLREPLDAALFVRADIAGNASGMVEEQNPRRHQITVAGLADLRVLSRIASGRVAEAAGVEINSAGVFAHDHKQRDISQETLGEISLVDIGAKLLRDIG